MSSGSSTADVEIRPLVTTPMVIVGAVFPTLSLLSVLLRFVSRWKTGLKIGLDDWTTALAWLSALPLSVVPWVYGGETGIDNFKVDVATGLTLSIKCMWVTSVFMAFCLPIIKISIVLLYKRVFSVRWFQIVASVSITAIGIWGVLMLFITIFQGHPFSIAWTGVGVYAINVNSFGLAQAASSFIIDLFVLSLPIPVVYQLHLPTKQKLAVAGIFGLGSFCVIAAVTRLALLVRSLGIVSQSRDAGYAAIDNETLAFMFIIVEPNCSIIAGCLPCLGPLFLGMRAPESLIRSVRSMISLRSQKDNSSPRMTLATSSKGSPKLTTVVSVKSKGSSFSGSQTTSVEERELSNFETPAMPEDAIAHVRSYPSQAVAWGSSAHTNPDPEQGINVTKVVEIHSENRQR